MRRLALTIHGPGYGLDEVEAFESEVAGVVEAVASGHFPSNLESIAFVRVRFAASASSGASPSQSLLNHPAGPTVSASRIASDLGHTFQRPYDGSLQAQYRYQSNETELARSSALSRIIIAVLTLMRAAISTRSLVQGATVNAFRSNERQ